MKHREHPDYLTEQQREDLLGDDNDYDNAIDALQAHARVMDDAIKSFRNTEINWRRAAHNMAKLPAVVCAFHPSDDTQFILIHVGEMGYQPVPATYNTLEFARGVNLAGRVTAAQIEAMLVGSMAGWDVPGADPDTYKREKATEASLMVTETV